RTVLALRLGLRGRVGLGGRAVGLPGRVGLELGVRGGRVDGIAALPESLEILELQLERPELEHAPVLHALAALDLLAVEDRPRGRVEVDDVNRAVVLDEHAVLVRDALVLERERAGLLLADRDREALDRDPGALLRTFRDLERPARLRPLQGPSARAVGARAG